MLCQYVNCEKDPNEIDTSTAWSEQTRGYRRNGIILKEGGNRRPQVPWVQQCLHNEYSQLHLSLRSYTFHTASGDVLEMQIEHALVGNLAHLQRSRMLVLQYER